MSKRIDFAISNALSLKVVEVHGAANPLDMLTEGRSTAPEEVHGAANLLEVHGAALGIARGGGHKVVCVHGACDLTLAQPQKLSRVEVRRGPNGDLIITLHE